MELKNLSLTEIIGKIKDKEIDQKQVQDYFLARIALKDSEIGAFTHTPDSFETQDENTPLAGAPIAVKDIYNEVGTPTQIGSKMLDGYTSPYDATAIANLKKAGFTSLGKVTMDEFAMGGSGETSALSIAKNPWDTTRIPGGSSSGSAAAVAAGLAPAALGTDTGGSIRQPAAMCGVVGFKPTYGRISRYGVIAMASSLDTMGTLTKTVQDAGLLYEAMAGQDPLDSTSLSEDFSIDPTIWKAEDVKGLKIGIPKEYFGDGIEAGVRKQIEHSIEILGELGAEMVEISLPHTDYGLAVYYLVMPSEASTNLGRYDGIRFGSADDAGKNLIDLYKTNRAKGFGPEVKRRIMLGTHALSSGFYDAYYGKASKVRELIKKDFDEAFKQVDIILTPTAPTVAWKIGEKIDDPIKMYMSDIFTVPSSLAGVPAISVPCGYATPEDSGDVDLPVGLQLIGPRLGEQTVLKTAHVFEQTVKNKISQKQPLVF